MQRALGYKVKCVYLRRARIIDNGAAEFIAANVITALVRDQAY